MVGWGGVGVGRQARLQTGNPAAPFQARAPNAAHATPPVMPSSCPGASAHASCHAYESQEIREIFREVYRVHKEKERFAGIVQV